MMRLVVAGTLVAAASAPFATALRPLPVTAANTCPGSVPYPNDPNYDPAERSHLGSTTWNSEQWYLYGCMPFSSPLDSTDTAAGMSIDKAWATYGHGSGQVIVAYMEGGVNWRITQSCELKDQAYLNQGELPLPENAQGKTRADLGQGGDLYDLNNDGVVNVEDYIADPRVAQALQGVPKSPAGGPFLHHICGAPGGPAGGTDITPEDLIVAFGHCQVDRTLHLVVGAHPCDVAKHFDNDGNGYANDINGWNFNRDNNDPQTEQSIYGHFDGEASQLVGQANNGFRDAGMCPNCRFIPIKAGDEAIDRPDRVAEAVTYAADAGVKVLDATSASLGLTSEVQAAIDYAYHKGMVITWASNDFESADHTDGMFYPHVWPGNSVVANLSTRGADLPTPFYLANTTFLSRSSLTSYGPHALFSVSTNDGSTSTATPTQAGVAALVASEGVSAGYTGGSQLSAEEIRQVVRATSQYIGAVPCVPKTCFQGLPGPGVTFNIMYGYGRPNVFLADQAVAQGHIPPTADIRSPDWYQEIDPTKQSTLRVSADVAAGRSPSGAYTYELQYGLGPEPKESEFHTFASGSRSGPANVSANLDLSQLPSSFWSGQYTVNPSTRQSIEQYDVTVRVQVHARDATNTSQLGEDRRAFHVRHDSTERPGFPVRIGSSGESSPTMADVEGRGWLDTVVGTADGTVHAIRPDGTEAPGFPVHTGPATGMDPGYDTNYLNTPAWKSGLPRPRDGALSALAVGDLRHDGALEIVMSTFSGRTYAWDGSGKLLPGFPVLNGSPPLYHMSVPPPDTPYSFEPENITGGSPVLVDLKQNGDKHLDIVQVAGDNHIYAWHVTDTGVQAVPGWPVSDILPPGALPAGTQQTHDAKIVPTPAVVDVNGDGTPDLLVGLTDSAMQKSTPSNLPIQGFVEAFYGQGTTRSASGQIPGWPVKIQGLIQGYGVAQDFVTQGVESPVVFDTPGGPQAVVNTNLFLPSRIDINSRKSFLFPPGLAPIGVPGAPPLPAGVPAPPIGGAPVQFTTSASVGNLLGGPLPQVAQAGSTALEVALGITQTPGLGIRVDNGISVWQPLTGSVAPAAGAPLPQYSQYVQGLGFFTAPAIADVSGDGRPDLVQPADSGAIMGFDGLTGLPAAGFPKWSGGWSLFTPSVGDLTGSGHVGVAAMTREGYLNLWDTPGLTSANHEAWHWHQDDRNTGHYGTDTRPPAGVRDLKVTAGAGGDVLDFTAPGDDWNYGAAASYQVRWAHQPIAQADFAQGTAVAVTATPQPGGSHERITVPHVPGKAFYAVRAIDKAGNIGPVAVSLDDSGDHVSALGNFASAGNLLALPNTASAPAGDAGVLVALGAGVVVGLSLLAIHRRRASAA